MQLRFCHAYSQRNTADCGILDDLAVAHSLQRAIQLPDMAQLPRFLPHCLIDAVLDGMLRRQCLHPAGQIERQLLQRELIQQALHQPGDLLLTDGLAVDGNALHAVAPVDVPDNAAGSLPFRLGGVQQHHKGLADLLQFTDHAGLGLLIILTGDIGHRAVCGHHDPHGGVIRNDLSGADLRGLRHGYFIIVPRGHDHTGRQILELAYRAGNHIAYAVNEPHREADTLVKVYLHRFLRYEFWLGGHDGTSGAALGQFVLGPVTAVHVADMRDHLCLHKALDKGGLSSPDRAYHANIDAVLSPRCHILINACGLIHGIFLRCCFYFISMWSCLSVCKNFLIICE